MSRPTLPPSPLLPLINLKNSRAYDCLFFEKEKKMNGNCVHCGKHEIHTGKGWSTVQCTECFTIHSEDLKHNQAIQLRYKAGEITKEECLAQLRFRIKEMYYSNTETATGGEEKQSAQ